jgi:hypothetical protein
MLQLLEVFHQGSDYDAALKQVYGFDQDGLDMGIPLQGQIDRRHLDGFRPRPEGQNTSGRRFPAARLATSLPEPGVSPPATLPPAPMVPPANSSTVMVKLFRNPRISANQSWINRTSLSF